MSKFHATQESMNIDGKRKPTYEQLVEQVKQKDKQIEELMIGETVMQQNILKQR